MARVYSLGRLIVGVTPLLVNVQLMTTHACKYNICTALLTLKSTFTSIILSLSFRLNFTIPVTL